MPDGHIESRAKASQTSVPAGGVTLRLAYAPPYDWTAMLGFFALRAVDGVERIVGDVYSRTIRHRGECGTIEVAHDPRQNSLLATVRLPLGTALGDVAAVLRRMFDLDADVGAVAVHLARDPLLAPLLAARPGLRVPGGWGGFEVAMRAVIGQQVSIAAARRLNGRLVARCGSCLPEGAATGLCRLFPTPEQVLAADLSDMGMPGARIAALQAVAEAALADPDLFQAGAAVEETVARLRVIRGIGEWSAHYIAMRACREMDAFPASDVGLLRATASAEGLRPSPAELRARAEAWRPWRAYAAQHLWAADAARFAGG